MTALWNLLGLLYARSLYFSCVEGENQLYQYRVFAVLHILSWVLQIAGHKFFEGRAPAFTDNLLLALNAPFFVTAEVLYVCGWKKEEFEQINKQIVERVDKFKKKKKTK